MSPDTTDKTDIISVRPRNPEDLDTCIEVLKRVHALDQYPVQGVANALPFLDFAALEQAFVAESNGKVIGHVAVGRADDSDIAVKLWRTLHPETPVAVLERLFVDPNHRGSGTAAKLIEAATEWIEQRQQRLVLFVLEKDRGAERLYRRLGWEYFGTEDYLYGEGRKEKIDALCFVSPR